MAHMRKTSSAAVRSRHKGGGARRQVQFGTLCPHEAQTATDTVNIRSVKLISTLLAGPRKAAAGRSDGVTYEEGQDSGVRRGEGWGKGWGALLRWEVEGDKGERRWGVTGWKTAICWVKRSDITQGDW